MFPEQLSRFICYFYYCDSKFWRGKSLLIRRCSNRKWHFKEPSDGGTYNATKCKPPFQQDLPLSSSLSHHPGFTVTTTWHSRLSANINSTLCCSVVSTMPNGTLARNPSSVTVGVGWGGGTSNSTAAVTFIRKSQDVGLSTPLSHLFLCPPLYRKKCSFYSFFFYTSVATIGITFSSMTVHADTSTCHCVLVAVLRSDMYHTLTSSCVFLQVTGAIECNCTKAFSNVRKSRDLWLSLPTDRRKVPQRHKRLPKSWPLMQPKQEANWHWNTMISNINALQELFSCNNFLFLILHSSRVKINTCGGFYKSHSS